ncbi:hypothetical protein BGZ94_009681, partial [Podila epigama]
MPKSMDHIPTRKEQKSKHKKRSRNNDGDTVTLQKDTVIESRVTDDLDPDYVKRQKKEKKAKKEKRKNETCKDQELNLEKKDNDNIHRLATVQHEDFRDQDTDVASTVPPTAGMPTQPRIASTITTASVPTTVVEQSISASNVNKTTTETLAKLNVRAPSMLPRTVLATRMVPRQIGCRKASPASVSKTTTAPSTSIIRAKDIVSKHTSTTVTSESCTSTFSSSSRVGEGSYVDRPSPIIKAEPIVVYPKDQENHRGEYPYGNYPHYYAKRITEQKRIQPSSSVALQQNGEISNSNNNNSARKRYYPQSKITVKSIPTTPSVLLPSTQYEHQHCQSDPGTGSGPSSSVSHAVVVKELARRVDLRLEFLEPSWFYKKRVLDIGCNAALLTVFIALHYGPQKIQGVDIDPSLIGKAQNFVRKTFSQISYQAYTQSRPQSATSQEDEHSKRKVSTPVAVPYEAYFPKSMYCLHGMLPVPPKTAKTEDLFPHNIEFRIADWMAEQMQTEPKEQKDREEQEEGRKPEEEQWDVIIGFSLTKWIHLHHGDSGLQLFFRKVYDSLAPGGIFLVEPQAFSTYGKRSKITP